MPCRDDHKNEECAKPKTSLLSPYLLQSKNRGSLQQSQTKNLSQLVKVITQIYILSVFKTLTRLTLIITLEKHENKMYLN